MKWFMQGFSVLTVLALLAVTSAHASKPVMASADSKSPNCEMKKNVSVNVSFNNPQSEMLNSEDHITSKIAEVKSVAAELGIEELIIQSYNLNINSNNYGGCGFNSGKNVYGINGSINTQVKPADKGEAFLEALVEKGYTGNLYLNANRQCY